MQTFRAYNSQGQLVLVCVISWDDVKEARELINQFRAIVKERNLTIQA